ncbi:porin [Burkholderia sp. D-99]|uniref:porin n=1 Tax=Burkholderia sp. D-99 TaxID=2717316 RepID=UPI001421C833|nr:porin [Burkholderia sp. D-99]NHV25873.1 porin [Burkholderia sp. D-99]
MKLKFAAVAALTVFASASHAQSSVTLYGAIDSGLLYQSTSAASLSPHAANTGKVYRFKDSGIYSSYWGIRGTEDLGSGYKVNFKLQGAFDSATGKFSIADTPGATAIFNQYAMIGISGPFGSFEAGRQIVPMVWAMAATDARSTQFFGSLLTAWIGMNQAAGWPGTSTNGPVGALYESNALVYHSPSFYGATVDLEYAPGGVPGHFQAGTRESVVLRYSNYGLNLAAVYYNGHDTNPFPATFPNTPANTATGLNNNRFYYLGAMYTFRDFSVSASYGNGRNPSDLSKANIDMYSAGVGYRFSPALHVSSGVYYLRDKNNSTNKSIEVALGAEYWMSKRTAFYAQVGHVNNRGTMNQMIEYGQPVAPGTSTTAAMIGMRHMF